MIKKEDKKIKNCLRNEVVSVRYIRDNSRYTGKHILAGGLHKDCGKTLTVRRKNKRVIPFLDDVEIACLTDKLGDISYKNEDFWGDGSLEVKLINGDVRLNLLDPIDYIKWKMLQTYNLLIAPDWEHRASQATFRWVFVYNNDDVDSANQELDLTMQAVMFLGKYENNKLILSYLYNKIEGKIIGADTKTTTIRGWFFEIIKNKAQRFVQLCEDKLLEERAMIYAALRAGIVKKIGEIYYYEDNKLTNDPKIGTIDNAAEFISVVDNQTIKLEIEAKLNN